MPKFVPVVDTEKPQLEQDRNDPDYDKHRKFDNPFAVSSHHKNSKKVDRGWQQGNVGWGVLGSFGSEAKDDGAQVVKRAAGASKMVKNEKGLWVKAKQLSSDAAEPPDKGRGWGKLIPMDSSSSSLPYFKSQDRALDARAPRVHDASSAGDADRDGRYNNAVNDTEFDEFGREKRPAAGKTVRPISDFRAGSNEDREGEREKGNERGRLNRDDNDDDKDDDNSRGRHRNRRHQEIEIGEDHRKNSRSREERFERDRDKYDRGGKSSGSSSRRGAGSDEYEDRGRDKGLVSDHVSDRDRSRDRSRGSHHSDRKASMESGRRDSREENNVQKDRKRSRERERERSRDEDRDRNRERDRSRDRRR